MNWKDDQIEKLILFYSHNSLFLVPDFCYQKSCNWYQNLVPVSGTMQFLVPVSGQYVMGIILVSDTGVKFCNRTEQTRYPRAV